VKYFITLLKCSNFIIGNSSAGIREVPYFGVPSIDLGNSQKFKRGAKVLKILNVMKKRYLTIFIKLKKNLKTHFILDMEIVLKKLQIL